VLYTSLFSLLFLYLFSVPLYVFWSPAFYPALIIAYSLAYLTAVDWRFSIAYVAMLLPCIPGFTNPVYTLYLLVIYNALAYLLAGFIGRGWDRARSVVVFWIIAQVAGIVVGYMGDILGYAGGGLYPPSLYDAPFYLVAYLIVSSVHLGYGNRGGVRPWILNVLRRRGAQPLLGV